jgi:predicted DNA-binding protein with PD1-like motif
MPPVSGQTTKTGCVRQGARVWQTLEVVLFELTDTTAHRVFDPRLGFRLLRLYDEHLLDKTQICATMLVY